MTAGRAGSMRCSSSTTSSAAASSGACFAISVRKPHRPGGELDDPVRLQYGQAFVAVGCRLRATSYAARGCVRNAHPPRSEGGYRRPVSEPSRRRAIAHGDSVWLVRRDALVDGRRKLFDQRSTKKVDDAPFNRLTTGFSGPYYKDHESSDETSGQLWPRARRPPAMGRCRHRRRAQWAHRGRAAREGGPPHDCPRATRRRRGLLRH